MYKILKEEKMGIEVVGIVLAVSLAAFIVIKLALFLK